MTDSIKAKVCELIRALVDGPTTTRQLVMQVRGDESKSEWVRGWLHSLKAEGLADIVGVEHDGRRGAGAHLWAWTGLPRQKEAPEPPVALHELDRLVTEFNQRHGDAATEEGWGVWVALRDGADSTAQVQRIDCPDNGKAPLESDDVALVMVATGTGEHHRAARHLLARVNPGELELGRALATAMTQEVS